MTGNIPPAEWQEAFQSLVGASTEDTPSTSSAHSSPLTPDEHEPDMFVEQLNAPITPEDVQAAFKRLKRRKAAGFDSIKPEYLLDAEDLLIQPRFQPNA